MDSDLAESVAALKSALDGRKIAAMFGRADASTVAFLQKTYRVPPRYRAFLLESDPTQVEVRTPVERVRLLPASEIVREQAGFADNEDGTPRLGPSKEGEWKKSWIVVGQSALLGDPYFLDVSKPDAEGDCPVFTAMSGAGKWDATLCGSSFAQFLRILAVTMEVARGFGEAMCDDDDEAAFREAVGPRIKTVDPAALRAGHWT